MLSSCTEAVLKGNGSCYKFESRTICNNCEVSQFETEIKHLILTVRNEFTQGNGFTQGEKNVNEWE